MIRFAHPEYLVLLWGIPVLLVITWWEHSWRLQAMRNWANSELWDFTFPHRSPNRILLRQILSVSAIGCLVFAISGPQVGTREIEVTREGSDIAIAIDVSRSMWCEDVVPDRLSKARHEISRLLNLLRGDRISLIPFSSFAFVQVPLTLDYSAVNTLLYTIDPNVMPEQGTSLSEAIKQCMRTFSDESKAQRIIILITDGEDHEGEALEQAKKAAESGTIIYTVGMASSMGGPIPIKTKRGKVSGYLKDSRGATVISRLNEDILKEIADITDGEYYGASATGDEFRKLFKKIAGLDKELFETKQYTDYEDRFQWFAAAAFLLILIGQIIPPGRRRQRGA